MLRSNDALGFNAGVVIYTSLPRVTGGGMKGLRQWSTHLWYLLTHPSWPGSNRIPSSTKTVHQFTTLSSPTTLYLWHTRWSPFDRIILCRLPPILFCLTTVHSSSFPALATAGRLSSLGPRIVSRQWRDVGVSLDRQSRAHPISGFCSRRGGIVGSRDVQVSMHQGLPSPLPDARKGARPDVLSAVRMYGHADDRAVASPSV